MHVVPSCKEPEEIENWYVRGKEGRWYPRGQYVYSMEVYRSGFRLRHYNTPHHTKHFCHAEISRVYALAGNSLGPAFLARDNLPYTIPSYSVLQQSNPFATLGLPTVTTYNDTSPNLAHISHTLSLSLSKPNHSEKHLPLPQPHIHHM